MAKIAIVVGHSQTATFCEALGEAYQKGAGAAGHNVQMFVLARMKFDAILHEGFFREQPLEPDLRAAYDAIKAADHIVLIFPLWLGSLPAILKGFLERVFQPDIIKVRNSRETEWKILSGKSARVIMTMGMPGLIYRVWFGAHALRALKRNILQFIGINPVRTTIHGMVEMVSDEKRMEWLKEAEAMGRKAA
jgi:putative NADPH-quinone reductase